MGYKLNSFDLQKFGGSKTTVKETAAKVPAASPEEKALEKAQVDWAYKLQPSANALNDLGLAGLGINTYQTGAEKVFDSAAYAKAHPEVANQKGYSDNPDQFTYQYYLKQKAAGAKDDESTYYRDVPTYGYKTSDTGGLVQPDYNSLYKQAATTQAGLFGDYSNLKSDVNSRMSDIDGLVDTLTKDNRYNELNSEYTGRMAGLNSEYTPLFQKYQNGELPDEVKKNRYANVNDWANNDWANKLTNLAANGIVDTSITQKALSDTNKNADLSLAQTYSQDLTALNNIAQGNYNARTGSLNTETGTRSGLIGSDLANKWQGVSAKSNQLNNAYNMGGGLLETGVNLSTLPITTAASAQEAQINAPTKLLALASNQQAPTTDSWKTLGNWRYSMASPAQTVVSQGSSGALGGLLGGVGSYFGAKK